jgi:uncharacterized protein YegL
MKRTYVAVVVDQSGSMAGIKDGAIDACNSMLATIRNQGVNGQETLVSLITFNNYINTLIQPTPAVNVPALSRTGYNPSGGTALFDAVGHAVELLRNQPVGRNKDVSYLVMIVTDGEENVSIKYNARSLNALISDLQDTDRWTFAFQVPRGAANGLCSRFGISRDNVREWEATNAGVQEMALQSNAGFTGYFEARAKGATATRSFYTPVTTDLSKVSATQVKRNLDNLTSEFRVIEVRSEENIKDLVEFKTRRPYVKGDAYYLLMKSEKVQPTKEVLLMEKGKETIFGGPGARDLIGLPDGQHARVTPGNHSNYDIFVQSTSLNRILPRGTKILIRK